MNEKQLAEILLATRMRYPEKWKRTLKHARTIDRNKIETMSIEELRLLPENRVSFFLDTLVAINIAPRLVLAHIGVSIERLTRDRGENIIPRAFVRAGELALAKTAEAHVVLVK